MTYPYEQDPEEVGPRSYEDIELDMDVRDSVHEFSPGPDGRCTERLVRHGALGVVCGSTQRYSTFHRDDRVWCCSLSEQGIDCGHGEDDGYEAEDAMAAALTTYIVVLEVTTTINPDSETESDWKRGAVLQGAESFRIVAVAPKES